MKYEALEQTARYWVGQSKQEYIGEREQARGSVYPWIEAMKDIFVRCFKYVQSHVCVTARMKETCHEFSPCVTCVLL
jgi:hypothetical protein